MLKQYRFTISDDGKKPIDNETAYNLYAFLLSQLPITEGDAVHSGISPSVSQYVRTGKETQWVVNLVSDDSTALFDKVLSTLKKIELEHNHRDIQICGFETETVENALDMLHTGDNCTERFNMRFASPTAFKSKGQYIFMPNTHFIIQSLVSKWNMCFPDLMIEDEDGSGIKTIAEGLEIKKYSLQSCGYNIKGNIIPAFLGCMEIKIRLNGFHKQLAGALMNFSNYCGIGIKCALGMGGVVTEEDTVSKRS